MHLLFSFVCLLGFGRAHTTFTDFFINGAPQGDGTCVRMSRTPQNATFPLPNIQAPEMACGVDGDVGVARVCSAPAGAMMTFEFREYPDGKEPGAIDKSHKGPIAVYMKKVADPTVNGTAAGDGWFKIFQETFDNSTQKWATETLIDNKGLLSVNLPKALAGGYYLVRTELLALHEADKTPPDPQFYVGCAQIFLQDGGSADPPNKVKIPGYIDMEKNKAALTFNIYKQPMALPYPMFGPPVFTGASVNQKAVANSAAQMLGSKPNDTVLVNANWCGRELATFTTEAGCWNASTACWAQCKDCYGEAPPTGSANCQIWETKCKGIQDQCNAKNFTGPPNHMQDLTPKAKQVQVPPPANGQDNATYAASTASASPSAASQPTASASNVADANQVTTVHQTSFQTVTKTLPSNYPAASPSSPSSSQPAAATAAATTTTTSYASASPSSATATATSTLQANIGPDAFGSVDECGARNNSSPCGGALCCSQFGYCGATPQHCGIGCQDTFGACDQLPANSTDECTKSEGESAGSASAAAAATTTAAAAAATTASAGDNGYGGGGGDGGDDNSTSTATAAGAAATSANASGQSAGQEGASGSNGATSSALPTSASSSAAAPPRLASSFSIPGPKPTSDVTVVVLESDDSGKVA